MPLSKAQIKYVRSLQQKKYRQKYNIFVVEGDKIVEESIRLRPAQIERLYGLAPWLDGRREWLSALRNRVVEVTPAELKKISGLQAPNQVLALLRCPPVELDPDRIRNGWSLFLDGIRDPGNLGAIWRIADWFGISYLLCAPDCVDQYNPKVIQASMGAFLRVDCMACTLDGLLSTTGSLPILGADLEGQPIFRGRFPDHGIVVIGSEAHGLSDAVKAQLTGRICIPRGPGGGAEALSAAVAAGIICARLRLDRGE